MSSQKDDFSQNRREPEDSRRTNSEESTKWGNKNIERPTVVTTCAKDTTYEYKEMLGGGGGFPPSDDHIETWTVTRRESIFLAFFFLSPPRTQMWIKFYPKQKKKKWAVANSNRSCWRVKWKAWSRWHNKYCTSIELGCFCIRMSAPFPMSPNIQSELSLSYSTV